MTRADNIACDTAWQVAFGRLPQKRREAIFNSICQQTQACRETLPRGSGDYPGSDVVYRRLQAGAEAMAISKDNYGSYEHSLTMAIMGCGDEETQKARVHWLHMSGWIQY